MFSRKIFPLPHVLSCYKLNFVTPVSLVAYGTDNIEGKWSYQTLIVLQFTFVAAILLGYPFFPESPYWHLQHNREEQARKSLGRIHGKKEKALIDAEIVRIRDVITVSEEMARLASVDGPPVIQMFKGTNLVEF